MTVLVAGELNPDLVFSRLAGFPRTGYEVEAQEFSLQLGSASAILASGLAKLGTSVSFIAKIGPDFFGQFSLGELERAGVDVSRVLVDPRLKTGITVSISMEDRALMTYPGAIAELSGDDITDDVLRPFGHLHSSSFYLQRALRPGLRALFQRAHRLGLTTSLDPGCDPSGAWGSDIIELLADVDVFLPNEVELAAITGTEDAEQGLHGLVNTGALVVAKLGPRGGAVLTEGGILRVPAIPVEVVDTTGAGDSFDAGFLHAWLRKMPLLDCVRCGVICGGLATRGLGGTSSQPTWSEVEAGRMG